MNTVFAIPTINFRRNLSGGWRFLTALALVFVRAFTFASLTISCLLGFLFVVSPKTLPSMARSTALHADGVAVWALAFLVLMVVYLTVTGLSAMSRAWDRFEERSQEKAQATMLVVSLIIMIVLGAFTGYVVVSEDAGKQVKISPVHIVPVPVQSRVLLHIGDGTHDTNVVGVAQIKRLGPGHYIIWMQR